MDRSTKNDLIELIDDMYRELPGKAKDKLRKRIYRLSGILKLRRDNVNNV